MKTTARQKMIQYIREMNKIMDRYSDSDSSEIKKLNDMLSEMESILTNPIITT